MRSILLIVLSLISSLAHCDQSLYKAVRYEQFIKTSIEGLQAKKAMLEQKIEATKDRLAHMLKEQSSAQKSPRRSAHYATIIDASQAVLEGLDSAHRHVLAQIKRAEEEKVALLKSPPKNEQEENHSLQKAKLDLSIADLKQQIEETTRNEIFLERQKEAKTAEELQALTKLMHNWSLRRKNLELKLSNEQNALTRL